jgi:hypothetical protein
VIRLTVFLPLSLFSAFYLLYRSSVFFLVLIPDVVHAGADGEAGEGLPEDDEGDHQRGGAPQDVPGV